MCCFFTICLLTTWLTADSTNALEMVSAQRWRPRNSGGSWREPLHRRFEIMEKRTGQRAIEMRSDDDPHNLDPIIVRRQIVDRRKLAGRLELLLQLSEREWRLIQPVVFESNGDNGKICGLADNVKVGFKRGR
jgi:hypothetical protein